MKENTIRTNYFIEGLQGAGKSTLVQKLSDRLKDYQVFREGDYSPVELAWCAYVTEEQYEEVLTRYQAIEGQIKNNTVTEGSHKIILYTRILTDIAGFHKDLETYEIYNGRLDREAFEYVVFERFGKWNKSGQIFECSIFQNIIENQMLYLMMTEEEILDFYKGLKEILADKLYRIVYLDVEDITETIKVIRKERCDENGNELWFPLMIQYLETSPFGQKYALTGMEGLVKHLERRKALEHRIINDIFDKNAVIIKSRENNIVKYI